MAAAWVRCSRCGSVVHTFLYIKGYRGNVRRLDTTDGPVTDTAHERHTRTIYFSLDSLTHAHTTTSSLACARSCFLGHSLSLSLSRSTYSILRATEVPVRRES